MTTKPLTRADLKARYDRALDLLRRVNAESDDADPQDAATLKREVGEFLEAIDE